jgi:hypothetical protein
VFIHDPASLYVFTKGGRDVEATNELGSFPHLSWGSVIPSGHRGGCPEAADQQLEDGYRHALPD